MTPRHPPRALRSLTTPIGRRTNAPLARSPGPLPDPMSPKLAFLVRDRRAQARLATLPNRRPHSRKPSSSRRAVPGTHPEGSTFVDDFLLYLLRCHVRLLRFQRRRSSDEPLLLRLRRPLSRANVFKRSRRNSIPNDAAQTALACVLYLFVNRRIVKEPRVPFKGDSAGRRPEEGTARLRKTFRPPLAAVASSTRKTQAKSND